MNGLQKLQEEIEDLVQIFFKANIPIYPVGGCVRDSLLGRPLGDIDLATPAHPEKIKKLFTRVIDTGIKHGTVTVIFKGKHYEITTFRSEEGYSDYRHPDKVVFHQDLIKDLKRRDFVINAMAWDPIKKELIDPFGGLNDIESKILRCVGSPYERFQEDPLRILRLFRFQSQLGFSIEADTLQAAQGLSKQCVYVSWERKRLEWDKLLTGKFWYHARKEVLNTEIFVLPKNSLRNLETFRNIDQAPQWNLGRWAFHYWSLGFDSQVQVEQNLQEFRSSKKDIFEIVKTWKIFSYLGKNHFDPELLLDTWQSRENLLWLDWIPIIINEDESAQILKNKILERVTHRCPLFTSELPINGHDLINLGFQKGSFLGVLIEHLLAYCRMQKRYVSKEELLTYAKKFLADFEK